MVLATIRDSQKRQVGYIEAGDVGERLDIRIFLEPGSRARWQHILHPVLRARLSLSVDAIVWVTTIRGTEEERTDISSVLRVLSQGQLALEYNREGIEKAHCIQIQLWRRAAEPQIPVEEAEDLKILIESRLKSGEKRDSP